MGVCGVMCGKYIPMRQYLCGKGSSKQCDRRCGMTCVRGHGRGVGVK